MLAPPKQRVRISEFDSRTQRDAFTVSLEGLKGVSLDLRLRLSERLHISFYSGILVHWFSNRLKPGKIERNG